MKLTKLVLVLVVAFASTQADTLSEQKKLGGFFDAFAKSVNETIEQELVTDDTGVPAVGVRCCRRLPLPLLPRLLPLLLPLLLLLCLLPTGGVSIV